MSEVGWNSRIPLQRPGSNVEHPTSGVLTFGLTARCHRHANHDSPRHAVRVHDWYLLHHGARHLDGLLFTDPLADADLVRLDALFFDHLAGRNRHLANMFLTHHAGNLHGNLTWHAFHNLAARLIRHLADLLFLNHLT